MTTETEQQVPTFSQLRDQIAALRERAVEVARAVNGANASECDCLVARIQDWAKGTIADLDSYVKRLGEYEVAARTARQEHLTEVLVGMLGSLQYGELSRMAFLEAELGRWRAER